MVMDDVRVIGDVCGDSVDRRGTSRGGSSDGERRACIVECTALVVFNAELSRKIKSALGTMTADIVPGCPAAIAMSSSCQRVSAPLIRRIAVGRPSSHRSACSRPSSLRSAATASSRSMMTTSAPLDTALLKRSGRSMTVSGTGVPQHRCRDQPPGSLRCVQPQDPPRVGNQQLADRFVGQPTPAQQGYEPC